MPRALSVHTIHVSLMARSRARAVRIHAHRTCKYALRARALLTASRSRCQFDFLTELSRQCARVTTVQLAGMCAQICSSLQAGRVG